MTARPEPPLPPELAAVLAHPRHVGRGRRGWLVARSHSGARGGVSFLGGPFAWTGRPDLAHAWASREAAEGVIQDYPETLADCRPVEYAP